MSKNPYSEFEQVINEAARLTIKNQRDLLSECCKHLTWELEGPYGDSPIAPKDLLSKIRELLGE